MKKEKSVGMQQFGKDHWSLLAYIECRCVDHQGYPDLVHMRCNPTTHPALARTSVGTRTWKPEWGTRLRNGFKLPNHDDHDCADDLETTGLINHVGTRLNPRFVLTEEGYRIAAILRRFKSEGGQFADFKP